MSAGFTPGPWRISVDGLGFSSIRTGERNSSPDSDLIADVFGDDANASLIEAAPMLFEAAQDARDAFKLLRMGLSDNRHVCEVIDAHLDELEYALRKAQVLAEAPTIGGIE